MERFNPLIASRHLDILKDAVVVLAVAHNRRNQQVKIRVTHYIFYPKLGTFFGWKDRKRTVGWNGKRTGWGNDRNGQNMADSMGED